MARPDPYYRALVTKDRRLDGRICFGVTSSAPFDAAIIPAAPKL